MKTVQVYSNLGRIIIPIIRFIYFIIHPITKKKWKFPKENFKENPLEYNFIDALYLGYKYYYKPHHSGSIDFNTHNYFFKNPVLIDSIIKSDEVTLNVAGDIIPYQWIQAKYCENLWDDIGKDFFSSDIVLGNLETPISANNKTSFVPELMLNNMLFNGNSDFFQVINGNGYYKGFNALSVANNHSLDMGVGGLTDTVKFLQTKNIFAIGFQEKSVPSNNYTIIEKGGIKFGFIAATYSLNHIEFPSELNHKLNYLDLNSDKGDFTLLEQTAENARNAGADLIILCLHYGNAYQAYPSKHIICNTHKIIQSTKADLIVGCHAHNIQPISQYNYYDKILKTTKCCTILYSMGDFLAYDIFSWSHLTIYIKFAAGKLNGLAYLRPVKINPIYIYSNYIKKNSRILHFLYAEKLWDNADINKYPIQFQDKHKKELRELKEFYMQHFKPSYK